MAVEFITTDQTTLYTLDQGDEVFLLDGVTLSSTGDAFAAGEAADGFTNGDYAVAIMGDLAVGDDIWYAVFNADTPVGSPFEDVKVSVSIAASSTVIAVGDGFVFGAADADLNETEFYLTNAGNLQVGEALIFTQDFDVMELVNTGIISQWGAASTVQALIDEVGPSGTSKVFNSGTITTNSTARLIDVSLATDGSFELVNTGLMATFADFGMNFTGAGGFVSIGNTGDIYSDLLSAHETEVANDGNIYGQIIIQTSATGSVVNNGLISEGVLTSTGEDEVINFGEIAGDVRLEGGADTYIGPGLVGGAIYGGAGDDTIETGELDDVIYGGADVDIINTAGGNDFVEGDEGNDIISTGDGDDEASGGDNADILRGGRGDDNLSGNANADELHGQKDDDILNGGGGGDMLFGGRGDDTLDGSSGADTLSGGHGDDELTGGSGADIFVFKLHAGNDVITDFEDGTDLFDFSAFTFDTQSDLRAAGENTATGWMLDFSLIGGSGTLLIEDVVQNQIGLDDLVV